MSLRPAGGASVHPVCCTLDGKALTGVHTGSRDEADSSLE